MWVSWKSLCVVLYFRTLRAVQRIMHRANLLELGDENMKGTLKAKVWYFRRWFGLEFSEAAVQNNGSRWEVLLCTAPLKIWVSEYLRVSTNNIRIECIIRTAEQRGGGGIGQQNDTLGNPQ
jgi:hypothetical protein